MSNEIGLREARKLLGGIANRANLAGEITYLMRNGKRIAAVVPTPQEPAMSEHATYYRPMTDAQFVADLREIGVPARSWADYVEEEVQRRDLIALKLALASRAAIDADAAYGRLADPDADPLDLDAPDWHRPPLGEAWRLLRTAYYARLDEIAAGAPMVPVTV